ncbi:unnamed protein product [Clonostachys byssicola]|uniref:NmrA-like domain-containing protein n=1 Tax=Clonostachys byssicola TaxID=160290 RepID=A0A9N9YBX3_9HYPO|nr:unnamed protein product [Clonostachys byssicola]
MPTIFLTGATGYIGGQALATLFKSHPEYAIRALVRDSTKAQALSSAYSNVQVVVADLDNTDVVAKEAADADVVLHLASNSHIKSVEAIHGALKAKTASGKSAHWVQVSGASALAAAEIADTSRVPGSPSDTVFDDLDGAADIRSLIQKFPSRVVDNYLFKAATETPQIKTAIVFPPIIYGPGEGLLKQRSIQIPELAKSTLKRGRGLQVGKGLSRWTDVHIHDLGDLFKLLVENALQGDSGELWNLNGLYFPGVGERSFGEISKLVAVTAKEKGFITTDEIDEVLGNDADTLLPKGTVFFGTNARSKATREKKLLGWTPKHADGLSAEIPRVIESEAKSLGLSNL